MDLMMIEETDIEKYNGKTLFGRETWHAMIQNPQFLQ